MCQVVYHLGRQNHYLHPYQLICNTRNVYIIFIRQHPNVAVCVIRANKDILYCTVLYLLLIHSNNCDILSTSEWTSFDSRYMYHVCDGKSYWSIMYCIKDYLKIRKFDSLAVLIGVLADDLFPYKCPWRPTDHGHCGWWCDFQEAVSPPSPLL